MVGTPVVVTLETMFGQCQSQAVTEVGESSLSSSDDKPRVLYLQELSRHCYLLMPMISYVRPNHGMEAVAPFNLACISVHTLAWPDLDRPKWHK